MKIESLEKMYFYFWFQICFGNWNLKTKYLRNKFHVNNNSCMQPTLNSNMYYFCRLWPCVLFHENHMYISYDSTMVLIYARPICIATYRSLLLALWNALVILSICIICFVISDVYNSGIQRRNDWFTRISDTWGPYMILL